MKMIFDDSDGFQMYTLPNPMFIHRKLYYIKIHGKKQFEYISNNDVYNDLKLWSNITYVECADDYKTIGFDTYPEDRNEDYVKERNLGRFMPKGIFNSKQFHQACCFDIKDQIIKLFNKEDQKVDVGKKRKRVQSEQDDENNTQLESKKLKFL